MVGFLFIYSIYLCVSRMIQKEVKVVFLMIFIYINLYSCENNRGC